MKYGRLWATSLISADFGGQLTIIIRGSGCVLVWW